MLSVRFPSVTVADMLCAEISCCTNAVVAICVVSVPVDAVGAFGVPVKVGDAVEAFAAMLLDRLLI